ncbi:hypothetical protein HYT04_01100 [Candidatus Kaiserbacteria bacterium]|nr:hypothetical protein [Candidatus Kaiserbacteria bacterium]
MANEGHVVMVEKYGEVVAEAGRIAVELLAIRAARGPEGTAPSEELSAREKAMWAAVDAISKSMAAIPDEDRGPLQGELDTLYLTDSFIDTVGDEERSIGNYVILYLSGKGRLELLRAAKKLGRKSGHPIDRLNQENVETVLRAELKKLRKPVGEETPQVGGGEAAMGFLARLKQRLTDSTSKANASKSRAWDRQSFEVLLRWFEKKNQTVGASLRKEFEATAMPMPKSQQGKAPAKPAADPQAMLNTRLTEAKARKAKALEAEDGDALKASKAEISQIEAELAKLTPAAPAVEVKPITPKVKPAAAPVVTSATTTNVVPATTPSPAGNGRTRSMEILTLVEGFTDERVGELYAVVKAAADGGNEMARSIVSAHEVAKRYDRPKAVARAVELGIVTLQ